MDESPGAMPGSDEPARTAPDHNDALAAIRHSAGRRLALQRLNYVVGLAVGTTIFGLLQWADGDRSLERSFWGALLWGLFMAGFMWVFVRGMDGRMKAYKTFESLEAGHISYASHGVVTISLNEAPEETWRFGRRSRDLASGQGVWRAEVGGAPIALAYTAGPDEPVGVMWSRPHPFFGS